MLRSRITWLAAALVSGVVVSFVIPLCRFVSDENDRQLASSTTSVAQRAATLVGSIDDPNRLRAVLRGLRSDDDVALTVTLPDGEVWGEAPLDATGQALVDEARTNVASFTREGPEGPRALAAVEVPAGVAVVYAASDRATGRGGVYAAWVVIAALGALLIAVSVLIARRLGDRISTPVSQMAEVAHRLRSGDLQARAEQSGPDELVELGSALNQLAERIGELLAVEREAAADLSHRLRTPVTALRLDADLVTDPALGGRLRAHVEDLHRAIDSVVTDARRSTREPMGHGCDAVAVIEERCHHWGPLAEDQGRRLLLAAPDGPMWVALAEADLRDLVDNLVDNVFAHTAEEVDLRLALTGDPAMVSLRVEDGGVGDPASVLVGRGESGGGSTGLGLDIVDRLARTAGGSLHFEQSTLGGLAAVVRLRRQAASSPSR